MPTWLPDLREIFGITDSYPCEGSTVTGGPSTRSLRTHRVQIVSRSRHTDDHADPAPAAPLDPASTIAALGATHHALDDLSTLPVAPGLYACWAAPDVFPQPTCPPRPTDTGARLLYVGLATKLRRRITSNHLRRSRSSTLRRTPAGLLLDTESYRTRRTDRVLIVDEDEIRLIAWMHAQLRVSWCEHPTPAAVEATVIEQWAPPLNVAPPAARPVP
ncbi:GIY-YIG nuclease family protein [Rhodococcus sp. NPDC056960]|uniref:GIY-YIG nuclease family protein n=1 Tax=Rhodococcus TaxID=1827 RepID=UPI003642824C